MPRHNTVKDFKVEVIVYADVEGVKTPVPECLDEYGDEHEIIFNVYATFSPYYPATWDGPAEGGELEDLEVTDKDGKPVLDRYLETYFTDVRRMNFKTNQLEDKFITLYEYICDQF